MSVLIDNTKLRTMTHKGYQVKNWIHDAVTVWKRIMALYTNGTQNVPFTQSYSTDWTTDSGVNFENNRITIWANAWSGRVIGTTNMIDLTNYDILNVEYSTSADSTKKILSASVSSLTTSEYVWLHVVNYSGDIIVAFGTNIERSDKNGQLVSTAVDSVSNTKTVYIHRIWLE